jgi:UDP-3-O-[3-hydroxymyristoyl] glucosamine N-acyltransferase
LSGWESLPSECCFISSLYDPKKNVEFYRKIRSLSIPEDRWVTVADPTEIVSSSATLGRGVYLGPATILEPNVSLGNWCAMLGRVYVGHDTRIDAYTVCANSVSIAGGVMVGSASFIGANATIREYLRIGRCTLASVGAAVIRDIPEGSIAVGDPSRIIGRTPVVESPPEQSEEADICAMPVPIIKSIEERFRPSKAAASAVTTTI